MVDTNECEGAVQEHAQLATKFVAAALGALALTLVMAGCVILLAQPKSAADAAAKRGETLYCLSLVSSFFAAVCCVLCFVAMGHLDVSLAAGAPHLPDQHKRTHNLAIAATTFAAGLLLVSIYVFFCAKEPLKMITDKTWDAARRFLLVLAAMAGLGVFTLGVLGGLLGTIDTYGGYYYDPDRLIDGRRLDDICSAM